MTIDVYGPWSDVRVIAEQAPYGNLQVVPGVIELAALAINKKAAVAKVAPYADMIGFGYRCDALGATTGITFGWEKMDGSASGTFVAVADTSGATNGFVPLFPTDSTGVGVYITATQTGAGTATGTVQVYAHTIHRGT